MYETVAGDFIYLNGDPVEDEEIIKATVPEQHRGRALEWLRKRKSGAPVEEPKAEPKPDTELLETIRGISDMVKQMRHEMNVMKGIEPPIRLQRIRTKNRTSARGNRIPYES